MEPNVELFYKYFGTPDLSPSPVLPTKTPEIEPAVLDAIGIFFKLKGKYEKEQKKIKNKILARDDLTLEEKRNLFQTLKPKCVNCKKEGGTLFQVEPDRYVALCNAEPKCKLHIEIHKGNVLQLSDYVKELREKHEEFIASIMKIKYNLLFKYANETETVDLFEKNKSEFDKSASLYDMYKTKLITITNLLARKETINITNLQIFDFINEIKEMVADAKSESNSQLLKDAVELYINKLIEVLKINRMSKYSYQAVEKNDGLYTLVQEPITISEREIVVGHSFKVETLNLKK